jgi:hypothetical protein
MSSPFDGPEPFYRSCGGGEPDYDGAPGVEEVMRRTLDSLNEAVDLEPDHYAREAGAALMALASHGYAVLPFRQHANMLQALRFIAGPSDSGALIEVYRDAGGGYEGLQAVARYALRDGR